MKEIQRILVVGAGVMGHGIALVCSQNGLSVDLVDVDSKFLEKAISQIDRFLKGSVERKKMTAEKAQEIMGRIKTTTHLQEVAPRVDFVIEAVVEDVQIKAPLFKQLNELCPPSVIFASNTSQISTTELGRASGRPDRFVGMHWFNPPPLMRLIEIPRGIETSQETVDAVVALAQRLGKEPVVCKDSPGFVVNRILNVWYNEGMRLLDEGMAGVEDIDRAIRDGGGFRMGPLELRDLVGLDTALQIHESLYRRLGNDKYRPLECLRQRVAAGQLGRKTGQGFYKYEKK